MSLFAGALTGPALADHEDINDEGDMVPSYRWAGVDRFDTAARIAVEFAPETVSTPTDHAIIARSDEFPDALAASYLSGWIDAPILLTPTSFLHDETMEALETDLATVETIYIVGEFRAVSQAVETELQDLGYTVHRLGGTDRYETAAEIATQSPVPDGEDIYVDSDGRRTAILAQGEEFADALVAGPAAHAAGIPLLLTFPTVLPDFTQNALTDLNIEHVIVTGGTSAVSAEVQATLEDDLGIEVTRLGGEDRRHTAELIAEFNETELGFVTDKLGLARGDDYPDALAFGPFAGREMHSIFLSGGANTLTDRTADALAERASCQTDWLFVAGGTAAVSQTVEAEARAAATTDEDCTGVDNESPTLADAQALPPTEAGDHVEVTYDEPITCDDEAYVQFFYTAGEEDEPVRADAIECVGDMPTSFVLTFPEGTVDIAADTGMVHYLKALHPNLRPMDAEGNEAISPESIAVTPIAPASAVAYLDPAENPDTADIDPNSECIEGDADTAATIPTTEEAVISGCVYGEDPAMTPLSTTVSFQLADGDPGVLTCVDPDGDDGPIIAASTEDGMRCTITGSTVEEEWEYEANLAVEGAAGGETSTVTFCVDPGADGCDAEDVTATSDVAITWDAPPAP